MFRKNITVGYILHAPLQKCTENNTLSNGKSSTYNGS